MLFAEFTEPHRRFGLEFVWSSPEIFLSVSEIFLTLFYHRKHPEGVFLLLLFSHFTSTGSSPCCLKKTTYILKK